MKRREIRSATTDGTFLVGLCLPAPLLTLPKDSVLTSYSFSHSSLLLHASVSIEAALCGVHCLNNLLQGPYFGVEDLMEIALELDRKEKELMAEMGTETPEYQKFSRVRQQRRKWAHLSLAFPVHGVRSWQRSYLALGTPTGAPAAFGSGLPPPPSFLAFPSPSFFFPIYC